MSRLAFKYYGSDCDANFDALARDPIILQQLIAGQSAIDKGDAASGKIAADNLTVIANGLEKNQNFALAKCCQTAASIIASKLNLR